MKQPPSTFEEFDTWPEAFDCCRERNRPLDVCVPDGPDYEYARIFPSGHCKTLLVVRNRSIIDEVPQ